ncbi:hypothetical protein JXB12_08175 [candidate division KSB1 bacterium]|nr:hypothetical protein [candidate division KSB1 bacterium]
MIRKLLLFTVFITLLISSTIHAGPGGSRAILNYQSTQMRTAAHGAHVEFFTGFGYFNPTLKQWNDGIEALYDKLTTTYYESASSGANTIGGQPYIDFGVRYHFNENVSLSLSIGHFKAEENTRFSGDYIEDYPKPLCTVHHIEDLLYLHEIRINPTLLTLTYKPPLFPGTDRYDLYIGGGVGYYFSSIKNEIDMKMDDEYLYRSSAIDTVVSLNLLSNMQANSNPLGFHVLSGINFNLGKLFISLEGGYHFAKASYDERDWLFFTQKQQQQLPASSQYSYKCYENKIHQIEPDRFDEIKINELDFSGFMVKGRIGLFF